MTSDILSQGAQAAPSTTNSAVFAINDATSDILSIGDALLFLADSEHEAMPSGLAYTLRALADRCHAVGVELDGIKLDGGDDE